MMAVRQAAMIASRITPLIDSSYEDRLIADSELMLKRLAAG